MCIRQLVCIPRQTSRCSDTVLVSQSGLLPRFSHLISSDHRSQSVELLSRRTEAAWQTGPVFQSCSANRGSCTRQCWTWCAPHVAATARRQHQPAQQEQQKLGALCWTLAGLQVVPAFFLQQLDQTEARDMPLSLHHTACPETSIWPQQSLLPPGVRLWHKGTLIL